MLNQYWYSGGVIKPPIGLIMGTTGDVPENWVSFTAADGKFLRGTSSDVTAGTSGNRYGLSVTAKTGGSHTGSQVSASKHMHMWGDNQGAGTYSPTYDSSNVGAHSGHTMTVGYRPDYTTIKLIQAQGDAKFEINNIGFASQHMPDQQLHSTLNNGRMIYASTSTGSSGGAWGSSSNSSSVTESHDHHSAASTQRQANVQTDFYGTVTASKYQRNESGTTHDHINNGVPSFSYNHYYTILRAIQILDPKKLDGIIGMYIGNGIPDKWELVSVTPNRYLRCNVDGEGSLHGNGDSVYMSGSFSSTSHYHYINLIESGEHARDWGKGYHSGAYAHNHTYSGSQAYHPERYNVKFIRYVG